MGCSSVGRAMAFEAIGRRFESYHPSQLVSVLIWYYSSVGRAED